MIDIFIYIAMTYMVCGSFIAAVSLVNRTNEQSQNMSLYQRLLLIPGWLPIIIFGMYKSYKKASELEE